LKILSCLKDLIARNNFKLSEIKEVEFVGGAFRYPEIKQAYLDEYEKEKHISTHLNGDETFTMGGLYAAATFSSLFRTRKLTFEDTAS